MPAEDSCPLGSRPSCSRAEGAIKASEAAQADAATKLQKLDEEVRRLGAG